MTNLTHDACCDELVAEARRLADVVSRADLSVPISTCPEWTLADLVVHTGEAYRWAEVMVRDQVQEELDLDDDIDYPENDSREHAAWLVCGAEEFTRTARGTAGDIPMWSWGPDPRARFWSRRMLHETVVHRADAELALGLPFAVAGEIAADGVEEFLENLPAILSSFAPEVTDLEGNGETLHLHATDLDGEWLIRLTADGFTWRRGHAKGEVAVRGAVRDLMLLLNRRLPAGDPRFELYGDAALLAFWLDRTRFV